MLGPVTDHYGADLHELAAGLLGKADELARDMAARIRRERHLVCDQTLL